MEKFAEKVVNDLSSHNLAVMLYKQERISQEATDIWKISRANFDNAGPGRYNFGRSRQSQDILTFLHPLRHLPL